MSSIEPGLRLKALRDKFCLTQREMADRCGLSHTTISKLEELKDASAMDKSNAERMKTLKRIAEAFGVEHDVLIAYLKSEIELDELLRKAAPRDAQTCLGVDAQASEPSRPTHAGVETAIDSPRGAVHRSKNFALALMALPLIVVVILGLSLATGWWRAKPALPGPSAVRLPASPSAVNPEEPVPSPSSAALGQRRNVRSLPGNLNSLYAVNDNVAWAAGDDGLMIATVDGFKNLEIQRSGTAARILAVRFAQDGKKGWAVGADGTNLRTIDGGRHWMDQQLETAVELRSLHFLNDATTGWAVGEKGHIFQSMNAGVTWRGGPRFDGYLNCVSFMNAQKGWIAAESGVLLHSADGGKTWNKHRQTLGEGRLWAVHFEDDHGWVVGDDGAIFATSDGGLNWVRQSEGQFTAPLHDVDFIDGRTGCMVGQDIMLRTEDGGRTWVQEQPPTSSDLWEVHMLDRERAWAVGRGPGVLLTRSAAGWKTLFKQD